MMTSEEGREEAGEEEKSCTGTFKAGNPPMTHVSTDVLKEFMSSISSGTPSNSLASSSEADVTTFAPKSKFISSAQKTAQNLPAASKSSITVSHTNGTQHSNSVKGKLSNKDTEHEDGSESESESISGLPSFSLVSPSSTVSSPSSSFKGNGNTSVSVSSKSSSKSSIVVPLSTKSGSIAKKTSIVSSFKPSLIKNSSAEKKLDSCSDIVSVSLHENNQSNKNEPSANLSDDGKLPPVESKKSAEKSPSGCSSPIDDDELLHPDSPLSGASSSLSLDDFLLNENLQGNLNKSDKSSLDEQTVKGISNLEETNDNKQEKDDSLGTDSAIQLKSEKKIDSESTTAKKNLTESIHEKINSSESTSEKKKLGKLPSEKKKLTESTSGKKKLIVSASNKKKLSESTSETNKFTESASENKKLAKLVSEKKKLAELGSEKKKLAELASEKKNLTELQSEKKKLTELTFEKKELIESTPENEKLTELTSEKKKLTESTSENEKLTELTSEKKKLTESASEKKKLIESASEKKKLIESTSEMSLLSESASEMKIPPKSKLKNKLSTEPASVNNVSSLSASEKNLPSESTTSKNNKLSEVASEKDLPNKLLSETNKVISKVANKTLNNSNKIKVLGKNNFISKGLKSPNKKILKKSINKVTLDIKSDKEFMQKTLGGNFSPREKRNIIKSKLLSKNISNVINHVKVRELRKSPQKILISKKNKVKSLIENKYKSLRENKEKKLEENKIKENTLLKRESLIENKGKSLRENKEKKLGENKIKENSSLKRVLEDSKESSDENEIGEGKLKKKLKKSASPKIENLESKKLANNCKNMSNGSSHSTLDDVDSRLDMVDNLGGSIPKGMEKESDIIKSIDTIKLTDLNTNEAIESNKAIGFSGESEVKEKIKTPSVPLSIKVAKKRSLRKVNEVSNNPKDKTLERTISADSGSNTTEGKGLTFSEALKSLTVEEPLLAIGKPQPLQLIAEIPSSDILSSSSTQSLTVLTTVKVSKPPPANDSISNSVQRGTSAPTTDSSDADGDKTTQGTKRPINELETNNSEMVSDLKKIRVFNENEDKFKKADIVRNVTDINRGLLEMSKMMEIRLQEEKALQKIEDANHKPFSKDNSIIIDNEDLERRTAVEMKKARARGEKKLQRIRRKDLEGLVIELFIDKVLYEHQLGQSRDLCKRLEATLETNRRKAAQFRKEVEDLKKVTQRLQAEHSSRRGQIVAPVKVKRSVGIQATPNIIEKGLMHTSSSGHIRVLSPSKTPIANQVSEPETVNKPFHPNISTLNNSNFLTPITTSIMTTAAGRSSANLNTLVKVGLHPTRMVAQPVGLTTQPGRTTTTQMLMVNPSQIVVQQSPNGNVSGPLLPMAATRLVRGPIAQIPTSSIANSGISTAVTFTTTGLTTAGLHSAVNSLTAQKAPARSSNFIDLTDDDEASKSQRSTTSGVITLQRSTGGPSGQFVNLPASSVSQFVLVPSTLGQPTAALVVGSMTSNNQTLTSGSSAGRTGILAGSTTARFSAPATIVNTARVVVGTQLNGGSIVQVSRHPAPLPRAPPQQTGGYSKMLPPNPILKLSHKDNSIVLSWNMAKTDEHERIASYQLYAYQEGAAPPTSSLWKKVGSVKALELPMACTLTQFMPGHIYHFAVRAVDIRSRLGPFSEPRSIRLGK